MTLLDRIVAPRASALGGAAAALGRDGGLVWVNPAGSAGAPESSVGFTAMTGWFGDRAGQIHVVGLMPGGAAWAGVAYYDAGKATVKTTGGVPRSFSTRRDLLALAGAGRTFAREWTGGVTLKVLRSELAGAFTSTVLVADGAVQWAVRPNVKLGAQIRDVGTPLRPAYATELPPSTARAGLAVGFRPGEAGERGPWSRLAAVLLADVRGDLRGEAWSGHAGAEAGLPGLLMLRGGYRMADRRMLGGPTAGLRFQVIRRGRETTRTWSLDYAVEFRPGPFALPHAVGLSVPW